MTKINNKTIRKLAHQEQRRLGQENQKHKPKFREKIHRIEIGNYHSISDIIKICQEKNWPIEDVILEVSVVESNPYCHPESVINLEYTELIQVKE